jgi:hypothetical protein
MECWSAGGRETPVGRMRAENHEPPATGPGARWYRWREGYLALALAEQQLAWEALKKLAFPTSQAET